jgi:probable rRNA maturation factor
MENTTFSVGVETQVPWPLEDVDVEEFTTRVLTAAAQRMNITGEVSVMYVNDETIHELNRTYRDVDRPTDVLSFAMQEGEDSFPEIDELPMLGDIIVSVEKAQEQAVAYGHAVKREMAFLLVHGFLHLIGYDHQDEEAEREMFGLQEEILVQLGLPRVQP